MQAESKTAATAAPGLGRGSGVAFVSSLDAKAQVFWDLSPKLMAQFQGRLLAVLVQERQQGVQNMSAKELREAYFKATGAWVDMSSISSTINGLVKSRRVERLGFLRKCSVTGHDITPIRAVPKQQSLV